MIQLVFCILTIFTLTVSCNNSKQKENILTTDSLSVVNFDSISNKVHFLATDIIFDTVYLNKSYKISLTAFKSKNDDESVSNSIFTLSKLTKGKYSLIFSDSIYTTVGEIRFENFNNDKIKDILIQNISDVRSNWTYNLYLIDTSKNNITKVRGFNNIKNPRYLSKYDLIENEVMSGRDWTAFYKINEDTIQSFEDDEYIVYWGQDENGDPENSTKLYNQNLKKVLKRLSNYH